MVEVENLTKKFGGTTVVNGVSFEARKGEILGFLGPNGAGKTTTMRMMTGFLPPTSGTARISGFDVVDDSVNARRHLGYLPENVPLYEEMTVDGFLTFFARLRGVSPDKLENRLRFAMEATNILERRDWIIGKLSKGFRRRVGIAQAIVHDPDVIILDEPTEGLDPIQVVEIRDLIRSLRGDHTVILSTHILPEAQMLADRILIINRGQVAAIDTTENLMRRIHSAQQLRVQARGPKAEIEAKLKAVEGVQSVKHVDGPDGTHVWELESAEDVDVREQVATLVVGGGWKFLQLDRAEMTLEDVFIELTGQRKEKVKAA